MAITLNFDDLPELTDHEATALSMLLRLQKTPTGEAVAEKLEITAKREKQGRGCIDVSDDELEALFWALQQVGGDPGKLPENITALTAALLSHPGVTGMARG